MAGTDVGSAVPELYTSGGWRGKEDTAAEAKEIAVDVWHVL